jgi:hypothetical protein
MRSAVPANQQNIRLPNERGQSMTTGRHKGQLLDLAGKQRRSKAFEMRVDLLELQLLKSNS